MSVTFSPAAFEPTPAALVEKHGFPSWCLVHLDDDDVTVRMHNGGAYRVLEALGYAVDTDEGMVGNASPEDVLGRCLVALAVAPADEGMPVVQTGSNTYVAPRPAGDLQRRLADVHDLALWCAANDSLVAWA